MKLQTANQASSPRPPEYNVPIHESYLKDKSAVVPLDAVFHRTAYSITDERIPYLALIKVGNSQLSISEVRDIETGQAAYYVADDTPRGNSYIENALDSVTRLHPHQIAIVGRNPESDVVVPDPEVSRQHLLVELITSSDNGRLKGYIEITDPGTTNGTELITAVPVALPQ